MFSKSNRISEVLQKVGGSYLKAVTSLALFTELVRNESLKFQDIIESRLAEDKSAQNMFQGLLFHNQRCPHVPWIAKVHENIMIDVFDLIR